VTRDRHQSQPWWNMRPAAIGPVASTEERTNAHPVRLRSGPGGKPRGAHDHGHRLKTVKPYEYQDAATLLADFWDEVYAVLKEKGVGQ